MGALGTDIVTGITASGGRGGNQTPGAYPGQAWGWNEDGSYPPIPDAPDIVRPKPVTYAAPGYVMDETPPRTFDKVGPIILLAIGAIFIIPNLTAK